MKDIKKRSFGEIIFNLYLIIYFFIFIALIISVVIKFLFNINTYSSTLAIIWLIFAAISGIITKVENMQLKREQKVTNIIKATTMSLKELMLLDIARKFISYNRTSKLYLAGSLMLKLRGIDLGREINDIDICIKNIQELNSLELPEGFFIEEYILGDVGYETLITRCRNEDGIVIDLLHNYDITWDEENYIDGMSCASVSSLLLEKQKYISDNSHGKEKHERDIDIIHKWYLKQKYINWKSDKEISKCFKHWDDFNFFNDKY